MKVWKENGKIKITENGLIYVCDDCPCGETCNGVYPSSLAVSDIAPPGSGTISNNTNGTCGTLGISPCQYYGTIVGPFLTYMYNININFDINFVNLTRRAWDHNHPTIVCQSGGSETKFGTTSPYGSWLGQITIS